MKVFMKTSKKTIVFCWNQYSCIFGSGPLNFTARIWDCLELLFLLYFYKKFRMKTAKIILQYFLFTFIVMIVLVGSFMLYFTLIDFQPPPVEVINVKVPLEAPLESDEFSFITWNIGYCGLDKKMDFFYDGGKKVRPDDSSFQRNLNGVYKFLSGKWNFKFC